MRWPFATILGTAACLALAAPGHAAAAETKIGDKAFSRWALLIGVDDYTHVEKLRFAGADQRGLRDQLIAAGFPKEQVFLLDDKASENKLRPFKANIERELHQVLGLVEREDLIVVALSGHGVHLDGKSYFCPSEARLDDRQTLVSLEEVYQRLKNCPAAMKLLLVDACRNDPRRQGQRSLAPGAGTRQFAESLERPPEGILLLSSCAPGQISMEDKDFGHGVFMHFVLEGLKGRADGDADGGVSLTELYRYVNRQTKLHVHDKFSDYQTPALRGDIHDDFNITLARSGLRPSSPGVGGTLPGASTARPATARPPELSDADPLLTPVALESMLAAGDGLWLKGQLSAAMLLYDWAARLAPRSRAAHARRAAGLFAAGRESEALRARELAQGQPLPFIVSQDTELKENDEAKAKVSKGWTVYVDRIKDGWLWVSSTREDRSLSGWIARSDLAQSALGSPAGSPSNGLAGTIWEVKDSDGDRWVCMFGQGDALYYLSDRGFRAGATWQLGNDGSLRIAFNQEAATLEGRRSGDAFRGTGSAANGRAWTWQAMRM